MFVPIWQPVVQRGASIGECPMFQKFGDGPINMPPSQKKRKEKKVINMNHSNYTS
jgi:hypothetical protein